MVLYHSSAHVSSITLGKSFNPYEPHLSPVQAGGGYKNKMIMRIYGFQTVLLVGEVFFLPNKINI